MVRCKGHGGWVEGRGLKSNIFQSPILNACLLIDSFHMILVDLMTSKIIYYLAKAYIVSK